MVRLRNARRNIRGLQRWRHLNRSKNKRLECDKPVIRTLTIHQNLDKRRFSQGGDRLSTWPLYSITRLRFDWSPGLLCRSNGARLQLNHDTIYLPTLCMPSVIITCCGTATQSTHLSRWRRAKSVSAAQQERHAPRYFWKHNLEGTAGKLYWTITPFPDICCTNHYVRLSVVDTLGIRGRICKWSACCPLRFYEFEYCSSYVDQDMYSTAFEAW